ncbi:DUF4253 domain-containing protein [Nonomuraea terrae]|uniref:DUF4253 domain-containing protein n=1 Tax=Nonomuraea terrae TaxID=2530383 RepID=UPI001FE93681|nr:DUF4253 domain-containing protein [Nonomuraea terrae]
MVAVGADTLHLSVAAPPATPEHASRVTAERFTLPRGHPPAGRRLHAQGVRQDSRGREHVVVLVD